MIQQLFSYMHQTINELEHEFNEPIGMDQELNLLEKYLTIKEMIEDISDELEQLIEKLKQFEKNHGLNLSANELTTKDTNEEVVIELDESDFLEFEKGIGFFDLWMYDRAIIHLEKIMDKYPDFNLARLYTSMTYFQKGDYLETKKQLKILFQNTDDPDLLSLGHNLLGMIYGKNEQYGQAINEFQQAVQYRYDWYEPRFNLAILYYRLGHFEDTILLLKEILKQKPLDWGIAYYLGKSYQKLNQDHHANEWFKKVYDMTKQSKMIQQIAISFEKRKQFQQAIYWFEKWRNLEPTRPEPLLSLSKNVWLSGDKAKAKTLIKKYFSAYQETPEALLLYAWILTDEGELNKLDSILSKLISNQLENLTKMDPFFLASLARLYTLHQYHHLSNDFINLLMRADNPHIQGLAHLIQGLIQLDQEKPDQALQHFLKTSSTGVHFPYFEFYLGYTHYLLGNTDEAKQCWAKLSVRKEH
ncbi:tetratricopeptide repeat protein [Tepidibacillus fermentans]|uniref:Tetratricopeptide repeat protein n=1 Tax=Tepidibacillus fermentans TaxID=1281767 RepID=A0A4R3KKC2_9BACI|nr:tetratricopeptide repeat protein [Tepidibacillus fermentans]TCS84164.1 tetratricopeptide repeat protein [Tepidibacillus fermentans]